MRDPEKTKSLILNEASVLFNTQGYKATSLSDITNATGLTKGAIYSHFKDKSHLEQEALKFMLGQFMHHITQRIKDASCATDKLNVILDYFASYLVMAPFQGGCPLMNAAIEVDDSNPLLKELTNRTMQKMHQAIETILNNGIKHEQLDCNLNVSEMSSLIISSLEGGIMMMQLTDTKKHLQSVVSFLRKQVHAIEV